MIPRLAVKNLEMKWVSVLVGSLGRVAMLDMMVGSATDRRSARKAVMMVVEGIAKRQRSAVRGEHSTRRLGREASSGQRDWRLYWRLPVMELIDNQPGREQWWSSEEEVGGKVEVWGSEWMEV